MADVVEDLLGQKPKGWQDFEARLSCPCLLHVSAFLLLPTVVLVHVATAYCVSILAEVVQGKSTPCFRWVEELVAW